MTGYRLSPADFDADVEPYLTRELPSQWKNTGEGVARLLWIKIRK